MEYLEYLIEDGRKIELGEKLGEGGEGTVHLVRNMPDTAAKLWKNGQGGDETVQKLRAMLPRPPGGNRDTCAAWPTAIITGPGGKPAGFTMPALDTRRHLSVFKYFNPDARERFAARPSQSDILTVARNLAQAMGAVHKAGHIIGDVNEKNTLVSDRLAVKLVDTDSMQVTDPENGRTYRCTKGRDDYTPPRLQGATFRDHDRTLEDDRFGLAVLIFKLMMDGVHPFASTADPDARSNVALGEKIKREYFPYNESGRTPEQHRPSRGYQEAWRDLDFNVRHLFRRAFDPDAGELGGDRPRRNGNRSLNDS